MKEIKKYFIQANTFLLRNEMLFVSYVLLYTALNTTTYLSNSKIDPYGITSLGGLAIIYVYLAYFFVLPQIINKKKNHEKIQLSKIFSHAAKKTAILVLWTALLIAALSLGVYVLIDLPSNSHIVGDFFSSTQKNNFTFGFYPEAAIGTFLGMILSGPLFFLPIFYSLTKNNFFTSVKRSFTFFYKNAKFCFSFILGYGILQSLYALFVENGNYIVFISTLFFAYADLIVLLVFSLLFIQKYKQKEEAKEVSKNSKQSALWIRLAALILIAEINAFFLYAVLLPFLPSEMTSNTSSYIYVALAAVAPFAIYAFSLHKRVLNINIFSIKAAIVFFVFLLGLTAVIPNKNNQTQVQAEQKYTGDELFNAINDKREEYGVVSMRKNKWACVFAEIELEKNIKLGNGQYTTQDDYFDSKAETTEKYKKEAALKDDPLPNFLFEYATYGLGLESSIEDWENSGSKLLFLDKSYTVGCAVAKDGYGVVVTGEESEEGTSAEDVEPDYSG